MTLGLEIPDARRKREKVRGVVVDNNDPLKQRRVRVSAPTIYGSCPTDQLPWAMTDRLNTNGIGNTTTDGTFGVLCLNTAVWVEFQADEYGDDNHDLPLVTALDLTPAVQKAEELVNYPNRYGFKDASGNLAFIDRQTKTVQFTTYNGTQVTIDSTGKITIQGADALTETYQKDWTLHVVGNVSQQIDGTLTQTVNGAVSQTFKSGSTLNITGNLSATISGTTTWNNSGNVTLTTPTATLDGNLIVNGSISASSGITATGGSISATAGSITAPSGNVSDSHSSLASLRSTYNSHNHNDPQGGTTGGPNQTN